MDRKQFKAWLRSDYPSLVNVYETDDDINYRDLITDILKLSREQLADIMEVDKFTWNMGGFMLINENEKIVFSSDNHVKEEFFNKVYAYIISNITDDHIAFALL